jgi:Protein of unknown function (DUF1006).
VVEAHARQGVDGAGDAAPTSGRRAVALVRRPSRDLGRDAVGASGVARSGRGAAPGARAEGRRRRAWSGVRGARRRSSSAAGAAGRRSRAAGRPEAAGAPAVRVRVLLRRALPGAAAGSEDHARRPDRWIDGWREREEQDALREVCRRFVHTYGPARPGDFREWFSSRGFGPEDARALFKSLRAELEEIDVEGRSAFVLAGDTTFPEPRTSVRLLPEYDVYVMGFRSGTTSCPTP